MSRRDLYLATQIRPTTIGRFETNDFSPTRQTVIKLAFALDVEVRELLM